MRLLLVGELNPHHGGDPSFALYPLPENGSGGRLARILGMSRAEYLRAFERYNLCTYRWCASTARSEAVRLARDAVDSPVILLGAKVASAFCVTFAPFHRVGQYVVLPHPSGRNRLWNDPGAFDRARALVLPLLSQPQPEAEEHR